MMSDASKSEVGTGRGVVTWQQALVLYALPLNFFASLARSGTVMVDGDTYLHLAAGRWIVQHHQFIRTDLFSYTFFGARWTDPEWFSEVAMAGSYAIGGWSGVALLFAIAFGMTAFLLARHLLKFVEPLAALVVLELALYCIAAGESSRPYALALPVLAIWTSELISARSASRGPRLWLLPLMTLWSNLHGSFLLGLALAFFFAFEALVRETRNRREQLRSWPLFTFGSVVAAALNPNGLVGLVAPIRFMLRPILPGLADWASTSFSQVGPFEVALLAFLVFCAVRPVRIPILRALLLLGLLHFALAHRREVAVFAVVAPLVLAEPLSRALGWAPTERAATTTLWAPLSAAGAIAATLVIAAIRISTANPQQNMYTPLAALSHVPAMVTDQHVFNEDVLGGFLVWRGIKPFIDSRQEMVTDAFFENYDRMCNADRDAIVRTFAHYNVRWTILLPDNPANVVLDGLPHWRLVYADKYAVVHIRD